MGMKDITGQRFGKLIAVRPTDERSSRSVVWECKCDCGNTTFIRAIALRSGGTTSCGCINNALDLAGQRFGRLTAIKSTDERRNRRVIWECKCDCGNTTFVRTTSLRSGGTTSCGCINNALDLTGQRFGQLTAVNATDERRNRCVVWECKCDCGNTTYVSSMYLQSGVATSCGCKKKKTSKTTEP